MQAALRIAATALFISALFGAPAFAQEKGPPLQPAKPISTSSAHRNPAVTARSGPVSGGIGSRSGRCVRAQI